MKTLTRILCAALIAATLGGCDTGSSYGSGNGGGDTKPAPVPVAPTASPTPSPRPGPVATPTCQPSRTCSNPMQNLEPFLIFALWEKTADQIMALEPELSGFQLNDRVAFESAVLAQILNEKMFLNGNFERVTRDDYVKLFNDFIDEKGVVRDSIDFESIVRSF